MAIDLLEHLDHQQFDAELVSLSPSGGKIFEMYVDNLERNVHYLTKHVGLDFGIFGEIYRVFSKFRPHVVHNHLHALYVLLPSLVMCKTPVRIHTIHNIADKESRGLHRFIQMLAFNRMGVIPVSISAEIQKTVYEIYGQIDTPVIYNGIDAEKFVPSIIQRRKMRELLGIHEKSFVFVNVASFSPKKNQRMLVDGFKDVLKYYPNCVLILVGDGQLQLETIHFVRDLGISNNVIFTGVRNDVVAILNAGDCFILPSDWEGLPISILEAMAVGKPIIATSVGGIRELVLPGENGVLFPPGNCPQLVSAMLWLLQSPEKVSQMGEKSREIVKKRFHVREMARQYGELYVKALENKLAVIR